MKNGKWQEGALRNAIEEMGVPFVINEGDRRVLRTEAGLPSAGFIGRTWQCGTIQLDMQMPQRFDLTYVGPDGRKAQTNHDSPRHLRFD